MAAKFDFGSNEDFIKNYQELKSSRKMAELYECSKSTILRHAKEINFDPNSVQKFKLSEKDKERIISLYNEKTSTELAEEYNVSRGMITKLWYDANLKGKTVTHAPKNDLTNQKFGRLTVLHSTEERSTSGSIKWLCKCDCGTEKTIAGTDLISGKIKSCGCLSRECLQIGQGLNFNDLTNQTFGKLTVIERCEDKIFENDRTAVQWLCKCSCGRTTKVLSSNLVSGNTQSCGLCGENSHGNIKIDKILTEANIPFEREKRFGSCKDKTALPFDFYVKNQYLIEYDGNYHFDGISTIFDQETAQKHDQIKNNWCKENNIPLIRIPYTHYDDLKLEDLILETSQFIVK